MNSATSEEVLCAVEALIFAADSPVNAAQIARIIGEVTLTSAPAGAVVEAAVVQLNACYEEQGRPFRIQRWAGGFRMTTTEAAAPYLQAFFRRDRSRRLTRPLMETLAILCYRQPATKPEVSHIRGVDSEYAIRRLLEVGLIDVVGRADAVGRPVLYGTTDRFLEEFGLADLGQLPNLREVEELLADPSFSQEKARLLMLKGLSSSEGRDP